jgi:endonuclease G
LIKDIEFAFGKYQTYQVPISHIEKLAELDFGILSKHDPLVDVESNLGTTGKLIQQSSDILL